jgi:hypothetical protein
MAGSLLFLLLAAVVLIAGALARRRVRRRIQGGDPIVGDDTGIREAEDRFWEETWEDPEEWRG